MVSRTLFVYEQLLITLLLRSKEVMYQQRTLPVQIATPSIEMTILNMLMNTHGMQMRTRSMQTTTPNM